MAKLSKKELQKIERQMTTVTRGETWVGVRPCVMQSKKNNRKAIRRESKAICRAYA